MPDLLPRRPCHPALSFLLAALSLHASSALTAWAMPTPSPDLPADTRQGYEKVAREILCYCGCARQSIYDCTCGTAHELRDRIEGELKAGKTPEDIIAGFVREHGEQVRVVPPARGFNRLAWIGPGIAILLGAVVVLWVLLRWSSPGSAGAELRPVPSEAEEQRDEAYRRRLARDLSSLEP